jgi:hypothetical protein
MIGRPVRVLEVGLFAIVGNHLVKQAWMVAIGWPEMFGDLPGFMSSKAANDNGGE